MNIVDRTMKFLRGRKRAYQLTFQINQPANVEVLQDLAIFCRATETCGVPGDHDRTWALIGRNEVWQRIQQNLNLTEDQLFALYSGNAPQQRQE